MNKTNAVTTALVVLVTSLLSFYAGVSIGLDDKSYNNGYNDGNVDGLEEGCTYTHKQYEKAHKKAKAIQEVKEQGSKFNTEDIINSKHKLPLNHFSAKDINIIDNTMEKISAIESNNNPNAISPVGARGQYQIMRGTWNECVDLMKVDWDYDKCWSTPDKNKTVGEYYFFKRIPQMLKSYNIPDTTDTRLACYNGGIGRVVKAYRKESDNWKEHLPKETREYINKFYKQ